MNRIISNWNFMRVVRLLLGIIILFQAVIQKEVIFGLLGGFVLFTALANVGCCSANGCAVDPEPVSNDKEVIYEELDTK